jgi:hypothetical protein
MKCNSYIYSDFFGFEVTGGADLQRMSGGERLTFFASPRSEQRATLLFASLRYYGQLRYSVRVPSTRLWLKQSRSLIRLAEQKDFAVGVSSVRSSPVPIARSVGL